MSQLSELIARKEALEREIAVAREANRAEGIAKVKELMSLYGIAASDLKAPGTARVKTPNAKTVAVKYRDAATGEAWTGRGLQPKWLKAALANGRKIDEFKI